MHTQIEVIGLTSIRGQSGKDTLCDLILKDNPNACRLAFGDELKRRFAAAVSWSKGSFNKIHEMCLNPDLKDVPSSLLSLEVMYQSTYRDWLTEQGLDRETWRTPRWHLQKYGNEYIRDYLYSHNTWLNCVKEQMDYVRRRKGKSLFIITDVRQDNETKWIQSIGGNILRIQRNWYIPEVDDIDMHLTDSALYLEPFATIINPKGYPDRMLVTFNAWRDLK